MTGTTTLTDTKIRWTNLSWNCWTGCVQVSPGCANCYAKRTAEQRGGPAFPNRFKLTYRWHKLEAPLKLKEPQRIFVNSMTDHFFEQVPDKDILKVFAVINECHDRGLGHTFQILTKRSKRMVEMADKIRWTPNIWMGVSVENQRMTSRIDDLIKVPAAIRFLSVEPLLEELDLSQWLPHFKKGTRSGYREFPNGRSPLDWIIVGGESGPGFRPMELEWAHRIQGDCAKAGVAFFFKQIAGWRTELGTDALGKLYEEYPKTLTSNPRDPTADRPSANANVWAFKKATQKPLL